MKRGHYAELYDLELAEVIVDAGESANSLKRPGLQRALGMLNRGEDDALLVVVCQRRQLRRRKCAEGIGSQHGDGEDEAPNCSRVQEPARRGMLGALTSRHNAAVLILVSIAACGGPHSSSNPSSTDIEAIVQKDFPNSVGVELAIFRDGQPLYEHGFGLRDRGPPDVFVAVENFWGFEQPDVTFHLNRGAFAPDANTLFNLASVSKEFTAGAVLLLQQDGKLSVIEPVSKYFPSFPRGNEITLMYLLQHRSGLVEYNNFGSPPDFADAYQAFMSSGQMSQQPAIDRLATFPLKFEPGGQYDYSNSNYLILGAIVTQVASEPLGSFMERRIFDPLGMTHTHQGYPPPPITDIALGYRNDGAGAVRTWQWNLAWLAGPGGMTSTVGDLEKWDQAVRRPGIFTQASLTQMFTPSPFATDVGNYADGWFVASLNQHRYIWHDGALGGFQTMNATFPDDGIDIIVLTNSGTSLDPYFAIPELFAVALTFPR